MKVDKELLVRHHFWVLLAAYTPMVFMALVLLWTSVAGAIDGKAKAIDSLKKSVGDIKNPKNEAWIDAISEKAEKLAKQKNRVWAAVWRGQGAAFTWPQALTSAYPGLAQMDFGEDIKIVDLRDKYVTDKNNYRRQFNEMVAIVQPVDEKGENGVVQFRGGDWKGVLHYVAKWMSNDAQDPPSSQDMWLAQEDYWVQRELLQVIRDANDGLAVYEKVKDAPKLGKDEIDHQIFVNPRWKLDIAIERDKLRWRITNRSNRQQTLGFTCNLQLRPRQTHALWIDGEPLAPNQTSPEKVEKLKTAFVKGIDGVEQVLDWRTAPIKRIDRVELPYHAHSTIGQQLQAFPGFVTDADKEKETNPNSPMPNATNPQNPALMMDRRPPGRGETAGPGRSPTANALGLEKNRYVDVSPQVRRMPVAIALVVDQAHMQDVLATFAKSRLRFQVTQVEWSRYRGDIKPASTEAQPNTEGRPRPGITVAPMPMPVRPVPLPMGPGGRPPFRPEGGATPENADSDEDSSNLVSIGIYGIASLYHKYPPKAPATDASK